MNNQLQEIMRHALPNGEYETNVTDIGEYGPLIEITRHGSDRKLYISTLEGAPTDVTLYDKDGSTIFQLTIFSAPVINTTAENLNDIIATCF